MEKKENETVKNIIAELDNLKNLKKAKILQRFFKTRQGQYGEGDIFLGISVPLQRKLAKKYRDADLKIVQVLIQSKIHEHRLVALLILLEQYKNAKKDNNIKREIFEFYIKNIEHVNNWDLVDVTAPNIVGDYLKEKEREILYQFAKSNNLWKRRIAIISTLGFIRINEFDDTIKISNLLKDDKHDLIHKAVGWMLREMGKRNEIALFNFLDKNHKKMPRTMLRYSIEKLNGKLRKKYMQK